MEILKSIGDAVSFAAVVAVFAQVIPAATAILSLMWLLMRIYESWLSIKETRSRIRKLGTGAVLEARDESE